MAITVPYPSLLHSQNLRNLKGILRVSALSALLDTYRSASVTEREKAPTSKS